MSLGKSGKMDAGEMVTNEGRTDDEEACELWLFAFSSSLRQVASNFLLSSLYTLLFILETRHQSPVTRHKFI